jgi:hypothetical protein
MAVRKQYRRCIPPDISSSLACSLNQPIYFRFG